MRIGDLISDQTFSFNAPFRILWHRGNDKTTTVFDSTVPGDEMSFDLMFETITAINTGDDGVLEIEFSDSQSAHQTENINSILFS